MRLPQRLAVHLLVPLSLACGAASARAQEAATSPAGERIDDPKLERRLGTRIDLGVAASAGPAGLEPASAGPVGTAEADGPAAVAETTPEAPPPLPEGRSSAPRTPRLKVGFRRFTFAQIGATAMSGPSGADEPFDVASLDFYPISSSWRFGLTTQYGWQEGTFRQGGDAFIAQSVSLGGQIPGPAVTPFFEAYAGGGYMQRTHAGLNAVATVYGQLGFDVGSELFLARHLCVSAAVGYLHAANGFVKDSVFGSFSIDTWSFKLGLGL
jgi:hypothetical protein